MLYATIANRWVSGIFERERDARAYLQEMPAAVRSKHVLTQLSDLHYPVYVVEDSEGFRFMTCQAALDDIKRRAPTANEDDCCLTLFRIDRDYRTRVAGEDEMGRLNHQHIDNEMLERVHRQGRAALRLMQ